MTSVSDLVAADPGPGHDFRRDLLARLRADRGLTQERLAGAIGYERSTVGGWESGADLPGRQAVVTLARFFGVPASHLLPGLPDDADDKPSAWMARDETEFKVLCGWRAMTLEQRAVVGRLFNIDQCLPAGAP